MTNNNTNKENSPVLTSSTYVSLEHLPSSQSIIQKQKEYFESLAGKPETWPYHPRKVKEGLTEEQKAKIAFYDNLARYFGGSIPVDLQDQWNKLNGRPDITPEKYQTLLSNQEKHTDYDQIKEDLAKWTTVFPNKDPQKVKEELDSKPELSTDFINDKGKIKTLIEKLLWNAQKVYRQYLESDDKNVFDKNPLIGLDFEDHVERDIAQRVVDWIIDALRDKMSYEELVYWWNKGERKPEEEWPGNLNDFKYRADHDWDGKLRTLIKLLGLYKDGKEEATPSVDDTGETTTIISSSQYNIVKNQLNEWIKKFPKETPNDVKEKCDRLAKVIEYEKKKLGLIP